MMKTLSIAAYAALITAGTAVAEPANTAGYETNLQEITETVCAGNQKVVFMPVSHDMPVLRQTYAVLPADNLMVQSARIVTPSERDWLTQNGCNGPKSVDLMVSADAPREDDAS